MAGAASRLSRLRFAWQHTLALPEDVSGYRLTWKRLFNLYLNRYESRRLKPRLRSRPVRLVVEPTNVCNLRCPHCHTGAGRFGRRPARLNVERYRQLLSEIGDYLLLIELFNWGESLLHPQLPEMIAAASARGIATRVNTNLSLELSDADAERLAASGLTDLFVSIDGATQAVYERYRRGGDLETVVRNCRTMAAAKQRLGRATPRLTLQYLEFPCNRGEGEAVRELAASLGMRLFALRGAVPDPAWGRERDWPPWFLTHAPGPCPFLWGQPVLTVDGHIAPCRGVFQSFDDIAPLPLAPRDGSPSFAPVWNHARYQAARGLFRRASGGADTRDLPCDQCPTTLFWQRWRAHERAGGDLASFAPDMERSANGAWNYFWARGQRRSPDRDDNPPVARPP